MKSATVWAMERLKPPYHQWVWAALFLGFALFVLIAEVEPGRVWPVAALLAVGMLIAAVEPAVWRELLSRVEGVSLGPLGLVAARAAASEAAKEAPAADTGEDGEGRSAVKAESMFDLRVRLEAKLTYVAKYLLGRSDAPEFLTVGSLVYDKFLTRAEGQLAYAILSIRQEELEELGFQEREKFVREAEVFVEGVRASVFWGQVKRRLRGKDSAEDDSLLLEYAEARGRRDDFIAGSRESNFRVAPAFALDVNSKILSRAINRLTREEDERYPPRRQIVVIPDRSREPEKLTEDDTPRIVKLAKLRFLVEEG